MATASNKTSYYKLLFSGFVILLLMRGGIAGVYISKNNHVAADRMAREADLKRGPLVKTALAISDGAGKEIVLIGEARPYQSATVYAKISGYMEKINVDKGDRVTEGQLLAVVDNPEIDQQYKAALTDLDNKKKIAERDKKLLEKKFISEEEAELSQTAAAVADANVKSLAEQQAYKYLKAPFTGTVTARYADPGALIQNAVNAQTSAQPVVTIGELGRLRIYIYVEQRDAAMLKTGYPVDITLTERPEFHLKASITRISGELDPHTRMMLCEIDIDNKSDVIVPGSYVQVHIQDPSSDKTKKIFVPSVALVVHQSKMMIATVDKDSTLHFKEVNIGENTGEKVSILSGITGGERVALSVGESLLEGQKVRIAE